MQLEIQNVRTCFCNEYCKEQMQQFYKGNYKILEKKIDKILSNKESEE